MIQRDERGSHGGFCSGAVRVGQCAPVAGPLRTIFVLAALAVLSGWSFSATDHLKAAANPNRVCFYALTLLFEWLLFVCLVVGVWRFGATVLNRSRRSLAFRP